MNHSATAAGSQKGTICFGNNKFMRTELTPRAEVRAFAKNSPLRFVSVQTAMSLKNSGERGPERQENGETALQAGGGERNLSK